MAKTTHQVGIENNYNVLFAINRMGYARTNDIAKYLNMHSASVRRTVKRLRESGQLLTKYLATGQPAHMLTKSGATMLNEMFDVNAKSGASQLRSGSEPWQQHRLLANEATIALIKEANELSLIDYSEPENFWFEREILTNSAVFQRTSSTMNAVPDVLGKYTWVEVERAHKNSREYRRLIDMCHVLLAGREIAVTATKTVQHMLFVARAGEHDKHLNRLVNALKERHKSDFIARNYSFIAFATIENYALKEQFNLQELVFS